MTTYSSTATASGASYTSVDIALYTTILGLVKVYDTISDKTFFFLMLYLVEILLDH
jgi:hypothetical protein